MTLSTYILLNLRAISDLPKSFKAFRGLVRTLQNTLRTRVHLWYLISKLFSVSELFQLLWELLRSSHDSFPKTFQRPTALSDHPKSVTAFPRPDQNHEEFCAPPRRLQTSECLALGAATFCPGPESGLPGSRTHWKINKFPITEIKFRKRCWLNAFWKCKIDAIYLKIWLGLGCENAIWEASFKEMAILLRSIMTRSQSPSKSRAMFRSKNLSWSHPKFSRFDPSDSTFEAWLMLTIVLCMQQLLLDLTEIIFGALSVLSYLLETGTNMRVRDGLLSLFDKIKKYALLLRKFKKGCFEI